MLYTTALASAIQHESGISIYIYIPSLSNFFPTPMTPLDCPRGQHCAPCFIQQLPIRYLFCIWYCRYFRASLSICSTLAFHCCVQSLFFMSASQFLPCKYVHQYHFFRFHVFALIYGICFSLSDLLQSA